MSEQVTGNGFLKLRLASCSWHRVGISTGFALHTPAARSDAAPLPIWIKQRTLSSHVGTGNAFRGQRLLFYSWGAHAVNEVEHNQGECRCDVRDSELRVPRMWRKNGRPR